MSEELSDLADRYHRIWDEKEARFSPMGENPVVFGWKHNDYVQHSLEATLGIAKKHGIREVILYHIELIAHYHDTAERRTQKWLDDHKPR